MSDDDFMQDSDQEYDFEYEDDEEEDTGDVDIENKYYNAKQTKTSDPEEALQEFLSIPPLEQEKGDWGFKALKQAIKLEFKLKRYQEVGNANVDNRRTCPQLNRCIGNRALRRTPDLCQVGRNEKLLRKVH